MHFQISLSLWELQGIKDLLCVRDIAGTYLWIGCYCCLSNFTWNQLRWSFLFSKVAWLRVCNLFAKIVNSFRYGSKALSHKLSTYYYNTEVCKDPNDYRSSRPEVFCKKDVLRNFAKFTAKHLYESLQACNFIQKNDSDTGLFLWILWNF